MPDWMRVLGAEPMAPVIRVAAELGRATLGLDFPGVGAEAEVAAADGDFRFRARRFHDGVAPVFAVMTAGGDVNPVVESPTQAVGAELLVAFGEPGEEHSFLSALPSSSVSSR